MSRRDQDRRFLARNGGGRDDHVTVGHHSRHRLALASVERLVLGRGIPALALGGGGVERQLDELRAETLDLLLDGRADVIRLDLGAKPLGGRDRLQAGHARADHEHPRRRDRAGGGHHHREQAGQRGGGQQHGLVAGDVGHRGQGVHALRPGDARDQLHRDDRGAPGGHGLGGVGRTERICKPDHGVLRTQPFDVGSAVGARRGRGPYLQEDVGLREHLFAGAERGARRDVGIVWTAGADAGALLHEHRAPDLISGEMLPGTRATRSSPGTNSRGIPMTIRGLYSPPTPPATARQARHLDRLGAAGPPSAPEATAASPPPREARRARHARRLRQRRSNCAPASGWAGPQ